MPIPNIRSTLVIQNLLRTYWPTLVTQLATPTFMEIPPIDALRQDPRTQGDRITIKMAGSGQREERMNVGLTARRVRADIELGIETAQASATIDSSRRQRLYDLIDGIREICQRKRKDPTSVLIDSFEPYASTAAMTAVWTAGTNTTLSLDVTSRHFGVNSLQAVISAAGDGETYRSINIGLATSNLGGFVYPGIFNFCRFSAISDSVTPTIGLTLRDASNRAGLFRTWNQAINTTWTRYNIDLSTTASASAGTWDETLIDEIAFTSLDANRTLHFDQVELAAGPSVWQFLWFNNYLEIPDRMNSYAAIVRLSLEAAGLAVDEYV